MSTIVDENMPHHHQSHGSCNKLLPPSPLPVLNVSSFEENISTFVDENMLHHHQSHTSCNKLLPPSPPVLNISSFEENMSTIVNENMPHHHQSHTSCNKLLPPSPPVLNIFSFEEDISTIVNENMPHHHQSHASCNKLLPPSPPVLNIFSPEEDIFQQSSRQICWDQIYDNYTNGNYGFNHATITTPTVLKDSYRLLREIGRGAFGIVHEAIHIKTSERVAVKIIENGTSNWMREASLMAQLDDRHILQLREVKSSSTAAYMIMDMAHGGELFERLQDGPLDETSAVLVAKKILLAVAHVHEKGIMHRDIKPENILIRSPGDTDILLADFGLALKADRADDVVGSLQYMAPEVASGRYTKAADMWSVGVVLYIILLGFPPFSVKHLRDLEDICRRTADLFPLDPDRPSVSAEAQALVCGLLEADPEQRLTAQNALRHPWICRGQSHNAAVQVKLI